MGADCDSGTVETIELTAEQEADFIEREALKVAGVNTAEFIRRWKAGKYRDSDDPRITDLAILIPELW